MQRLTLAVALLLAVGCGGSDKKDDPPPAQQQPKPQPAPQPGPPPKPAPVQPKPDDTAEASDDAIVIKGSKHKDATTAADDDAAKQAKIDKLAAQAKASQGQDNGTPYHDPAADDPNAGKVEALKQRLAQIDAQMKDLSDQKAALTKSTHRNGRGQPKSMDYDDPAAAKSIDDQLKQLQGERNQVVAQLNRLAPGSAGPGPGPGAGPGSGAGSGAGAGAGSGAGAPSTANAGTGAGAGTGSADGSTSGAGTGDGSQPTPTPTPQPRR